jgi:hypothetical protein
LRGEYKQIEAETNKEKGLLKEQTFQIIYIYCIRVLLWVYYNNKPANVADKYEANVPHK